MSLHLYDTARRELREFHPQRAGTASIYVCGATVQGVPHIGHVRSGLDFDVLRRWLAHNGLRRAARPQRHRHRRQDPDQGRAPPAGPGGSGRPRTSARSPPPTTRWAACRRRSSRAPPGHITEMVELIERLIERGPRLRRRTATSTSRCGTCRRTGSCPASARRDGAGRGRRRARQARRPRLHAVEGREARRAVAGRRRGAAGARAGTWSARRWPRTTSAPSSTSTAAASTWCSRTTRTSWPSRARPATGSPSTGCTTPG